MLPASVGWVVLLMGGMLVLGWMRRIVGFWGNTLCVVPLFAWHGDDANVVFVLLLCCGLLFENYIVDASIFWNLR